MQTAATYFAFLLLVFSQTSFGQQQTPHEWAGAPFDLQSFADEQTFDRNENWSVIQDANGILYVANQGGVLEFDGASWRLVNIQNNNAAFSLDLGSDNIVYVGSRGDFGYLVPDETGTTSFVSLLEKVPDEYRDFSVVWGIHSMEDAIYFQSNKYLFEWDGTDIRLWQSENRLHTSFEVHDRLFVKQDDVGLLELVGDSLVLIDGGAQFQALRVFMMEAVDDSTILIAAQSGIDGPLQLFNYRMGEISNLETDVHLLNEFDNYTFYHGHKVKGQFFALATLYDGVFVIDKHGALVEALGVDRSVPGDVNYIFEDAQGGIWLAHHSNGITHIGTPFALADYNNPGKFVTDLTRHNGRFYVATNDGLFVLKDRRETIEDDAIWKGFDPVPVESKTKIRWSLHSFGEQLLVATEVGVFSLKEQTSTHIGFDYIDKPKILVESEHFPSRIYVGLENGVGMLSWISNEWKVDKSLGKLSQAVESMVEGNDGSIWLTTKGAISEVWRLTFDDNGEVVDEQQVINAQELGAEHVLVRNLGREVGIVAHPQGIYRVSQDSLQAFAVRHDPSMLETSLDGSQWISVHAIDSLRYGVVYPNQLVIHSIEEDGTIIKEYPGVLSVPEWQPIGELFVDHDETIWIGLGSRLIKYDPTHEFAEAAISGFDPLIRNISIVWTDSTVFGGVSQNNSAIEAGTDNQIQLSYNDNDLRFDFSYPDYVNLEHIEYQYWLTGHDETWTTWSTDNHVNYRNIKAGHHVFQVRARSRGHVAENIASFKIRIVPPWYATWWMKSVYALLLALSSLLLIRYAYARKQLKAFQQERAFYARINQANEQLRVANDSLEQASKMKDEFLANASHELRTPLTAILGFTSVLKEEVPDEHQEFLGLIDENGKRLLRAINSLLDLAQLRAGTVELKMQRLNVNEKVIKVVELLTQLAKNQHIELSFKKSHQVVFAQLDEYSFERILYNLIGNAIKFTTEGSVVVEIEANDQQVCIHVHDTGIGIDEKFVPFLFDEFRQDFSSGVHASGSGLGLAISEKLVSLMNGRIDVQSQKGVGSTFTVVFPAEEIILTNGNGKHSIHSFASPPSTINEEP